MTLEELQTLHDNLVEQSALMAGLALFIKTGLDAPDNIDDTWVETFLEKMVFLGTASTHVLESQIGESATSDIYDTIMRSQ